MDCEAIRDTVKRFGVNVLSFRSGGDDFAATMQQALDSGEGILYLPAGEYRADRSLKIRSNTTLMLEDGARITAGDGACRKRGDFLLMNAPEESGSENITIIGGVWDGNYRANPKSAMYDENGYSGAMFNFMGVQGLTLRGLHLRNAAGYFTRFARLNGFIIEDIQFSHEVNMPNNDGIHLAGFCENGVIRRIHCLTRGTTRDDLIALNADDCVTRTENRDLCRGFIRNVLIEDLYAEMCHCFVRLLSVTAEISSIFIRDVRGGCRSNAVNLDAARYCRAPLIDPADPAYTRGVGNIRNVTIEGMAVTQAGSSPLLNPETDAVGFAIHGFTRADDAGDADTILLRNMSPSRIRLYGLSQGQLEQALADSKLSKHEIVRHADGTLGLDIITDYYDTLALRGGGFIYFSIDRI